MMIPSQGATHYKHEERVVKKGQPVALGSQEMTFVNPNADPKAAFNQVAETTKKQSNLHKGNRFAQAQQEIRSKKAAMSPKERAAQSGRQAMWDEKHQSYRQGKTALPETPPATWRQKLTNLVDSIKRLF